IYYKYTSESGILYNHKISIIILASTIESVIMDDLMSVMRNNQAEMDRGSSSAKKRRRNYDESYLKFGFTYVEKDGCQHPKCVICLKVLSVESMLPSKLKRHLMSTHSSLSDKPREFFARKLAGFQRQAASISTAFTIPSKVQLASFKVAYRIARAKKPHTIAENLILPAAIDMVSIMIGEPASKSLQKIPLSNNTIARRIDKIALDVNDQLMSAIRGKVFALQLDEATDSNKDAHLICYVRFIGDDNVPVEDLFFCRPITESCRAANLFEIVNNFIESNGIEWKMKKNTNK
uniref:Zinc finger protein n=1 Tax=Ciona intestinalis TaxID=7719 RepID=F6WI06_CIOIN